MPATLFSGNTDPLAAVAVDFVQQRQQLGQYSIIRASEHMQNGRREEAIKEFRRALAMDPQNTMVTTYIGNLNLALGKNDEAIAAFKALVNQAPNSSDSHLKLGNAYLTNAQYAESEQEFKTAARLDPQNPLPDYTLGMQYLQTDRPKEAEAQFQKVQRMAPGDGNVYYALGATYNAQGRFDEAVKVLNTSLSLKANNPQTNFELGLAYASLGNTEGAQAQYKVLQDARSPLAADLNFEIFKPKMFLVEGASATTNTTLGAGTPLWFHDVSLASADTSASLSVNVYFSTGMNAASVMNPTNWTISRAKSAEAGYYNNSAPINVSREAAVASSPLSVSYDPLNRKATLSFTVKQNSTADATIDLSHLVFKFNGKDAYGRSMDASGNEIDGYSSGGF